MAKYLFVTILSTVAYCSSSQQYISYTVPFCARRSQVAGHSSACYLPVFDEMPCLPAAYTLTSLRIERPVIYPFDDLKDTAQEVEHVRKESSHFCSSWCTSSGNFHESSSFLCFCYNHSRYSTFFLAIRAPHDSVYRLILIGRFGL